jgi:hypothetical protein
MTVGICFQVALETVREVVELFFHLVGLVEGHPAASPAMLEQHLAVVSGKVDRIDRDLSLASDHPEHACPLCVVAGGAGSRGLPLELDLESDVLV